MFKKKILIMIRHNQYIFTKDYFSQEHIETCSDAELDEISDVLTFTMKVLYVAKGPQQKKSIQGLNEIFARVDKEQDKRFVRRGTEQSATL